MQRRPATRRALRAVAATLSACAVLVAALPGAAASPRAAGAAGRAAVAAVPAAPAGTAYTGALAGATPLTFDVALRPRDPAALAAFDAAVSTPGSPEYHRYLTTSAFAARFGATTGSLRSVESAVRGAGLRVVLAAPDRLSVEATGSAARIGAFLRTSFARFRLPSGRLGFSDLVEPTLPRPLAAAVRTVIGLSDLARMAPEDLAGAEGAPGASGTGAASSVTAPTACSAAAATAKESGAYTANQLAALYGMSGLYRTGDLGAGVTVGLFELETNAASDIATYQHCYGTAARVVDTKVDGGSTAQSDYGEEATLDIEDVIGLVPKAKIDVYQGPNSNAGVYDTYRRMVTADTAKVISTSWGICEAQLGGRGAANAEDDLFEEAAAQGQSVVAASGDDGSTDCTNNLGGAIATLAVDDPGVQPYVTSVGGTTTPHRGGPAAQRAWDNSSGASGGGISSMWPMPAYQTHAPASLDVIGKRSSGLPCEIAGGYCREVPDVAANADPSTGYVIYWADSWTWIGGTSAAAPLWAAVAALADANTACHGRSVGFLNPALYAIASSHVYSQAFSDVTKGSNDYVESGYHGGMYAAGTGFDMATGLGTPRVTSPGGVGLANRLCTGSPAPGPGVLGIGPPAGPSAGGTRVTITGYGFKKVTAVLFGTTRATFHVASATTITAVAPRGKGRANVTVVAGGFTSPINPSVVFTYR